MRTLIIIINIICLILVAGWLMERPLDPRGSKGETSLENQRPEVQTNSHIQANRELHSKTDDPLLILPESPKELGHEISRIDQEIEERRLIENLNKGVLTDQELNDLKLLMDKRNRLSLHRLQLAIRGTK